MAPKAKASSGEKKKEKFNPELYVMTGGSMQPNGEDPRTMGDGPCGMDHEPTTRFQSNRYACWKKCSKCGLRLEYHSSKTATGHFRAAGPAPDLVRRALHLGRDLEYEDWSSKVFDGLLLTAYGERKSGGSSDHMPPVQRRTGTGKKPPGGGPSSGTGGGGSTGHPRDPVPDEESEDSDMGDPPDDDQSTDREPLKGRPKTRVLPVVEEQSSDAESEIYESISPGSVTEFENVLEEPEEVWEVIEDLPEKLVESKAVTPLAKKDRQKVVDVASILSTMGAPSSSSDKFQASASSLDLKNPATVKAKEKDRRPNCRGQ